jgi:hypothetical protein
MRTFVQILAVSALLSVPAFAGADSVGNDQCPSGSIGRDFDGLLLCVPEDNDRYRLNEAGFQALVWEGETPVERPTPTGDKLDRTLARVWVDKALVGTSDSASGKPGFDHFVKLIAASVSKAAASAGSAAEFVADVPLDESGATQPFQFSYLEPDLLLGRQLENALGPNTILFRPSAGIEQPHILLCGGKANVDSPVHVCMNMLELERHRLGIMISGSKLERSFRIAEQIAADLETFVVRKAP